MADDIAVTTSLPDGTEITAGSNIHSSTAGRHRPAVNFEYDSAYLSTPGAFPLSPDLPLGRGFIPARFDQAIFGAFADASPDQWGRRLIEADRRRSARERGERVTPLDELGFLLATNDATRQGALRFPGHQQATAAPALETLDLAELVKAVATFEETGDDALLRTIVPIGTTQGGARPKVSVLDSDGDLAVAKLPRPSDRWDVEAWEAATSRMAAAAGIDVPHVELHRVSENRSVLISRRFDRRADGTRRPYISARSFLQVGDRDAPLVDYVALTTEIVAQADAPAAQGIEMFRRVAFTLLVNNVDDHLRNHGFLRTESGWALAPAFDVNPHPVAGSLDALPVSPDDDPRDRRLHALLANADAFRVTAVKARELLAEVVAAVDRWATFALDAGVPRESLAAMADAFAGDPRREAASALGQDPAATIDLSTAPPRSTP